MAWTAPMTAVSGTIWTSAQFNAHIRDNLLETMPGKATAANRMFVSNGANSIAERVPTQVTVATSQTTVSPTYANLATTGPTVTVTTGTKAIAWFGAEMSHSSNGETSMSVEVSGATSVSASDNWRCMQSGTTATNPNRFVVCHLFTNLTAGSNVFTSKYKTSSGTATFVNRDLIVLPL
jgi:hypothetical protein